ncbi:MAG: acyl-CoA thioesterase II, partial [Alteromonadaceae bacterium]
TTEGILPHSLHAYFLRPGVVDTPVIYDVNKVRDGRSILSRQAVARQSGRPILEMSTSFHKKEEGYEHQAPFPENIASPEELLKTIQPEYLKIQFSNSGEETPFILLPGKQTLFTSSEKEEPHGYYWMKATETLSDSPTSHLCALTFASDFGLLSTSLLPHETTIYDRQLMAASIDHAMWFHNSAFRADEWMLCYTYSPWAGSARGFTVGSIYSLDKRLIATTTQEGLIRRIPKAPPNI